MKEKDTEKKYATECILQSREFSGFQREFARALLTESAYTLREARAILNRFFKGGER